MAGDWIKMRTSLLTNTKVNGIARALECSERVCAVLSTGFHGCMSEIVTRSVMRHVTVSSLLVIWGAANEHTKDGVFRDADLEDIDDMVGIPGFGEAMVAAGWAEFDEQNFTVSLPNFEEYNTSGELRSAGAKSAAQRQKEYRERKKQDQSQPDDRGHAGGDVTRYVTGDATSDVTRNRREEKRREEINTPKAPKGVTEGFEQFWASYPSKVGKGAAQKAFAKLKPSQDLQQDILAALADQKRSVRWLKDGGQFIPNPATWINQQRWLDGGDEPRSSGGLNLVGAI
jgi:hypothetical protein